MKAFLLCALLATTSLASLAQGLQTPFTTRVDTPPVPYEQVWFGQQTTPVLTPETLISDGAYRVTASDRFATPPMDTLRFMDNGETLLTRYADGRLELGAAVKRELLAEAMRRMQSFPITLGTAVPIDVDATAEQLPSVVNVSGVILQCICPDQAIYYSGTSAVTAATGIKLSDGQTAVLAVGNPNVIWVIASAANQELRMLPYTAQ